MVLRRCVFSRFFWQRSFSCVEFLDFISELRIFEMMSFFLRILFALLFAFGLSLSWWFFFFILISHQVGWLVFGFEEHFAFAAVFSVVFFPPKSKFLPAFATHVTILRPN